MISVIDTVTDADLLFLYGLAVNSRVKRLGGVAGGAGSVPVAAEQRQSHSNCSVTIGMTLEGTTYDTILLIL